MPINIHTDNLIRCVFYRTFTKTFPVFFFLFYEIFLFFFNNCTLYEFLNFAFRIQYEIMSINSFYYGWIYPLSIDNNVTWLFDQFSYTFYDNTQQIGLRKPASLNSKHCIIQFIHRCTPFLPTSSNLENKWCVNNAEHK